jgi:hypothetical protein
MALKSFIKDITGMKQTEVDLLLKQFNDKEIKSINIVPAINISSFGSAISSRNYATLYIIYEEQ